MFQGTLTYGFPDYDTCHYSIMLLLCIMSTSYRMPVFLNDELFHSELIHTQNGHEDPAFLHSWRTAAKPETPLNASPFQSHPVLELGNKFFTKTTVCKVHMGSLVSGSDLGHGGFLQNWRISPELDIGGCCFWTIMTANNLRSNVGFYGAKQTTGKNGAKWEKAKAKLHW